MAMYSLAKPMLVKKNQKHTFKVWPPGSRTIKMVIVHIAQGGSLQGIKNWFEDEEKIINKKKTFGFAGAHFAISKGGEIWQLIDTKDEAHGAGAANPTSIHIENVGFPGDVLTEDQIHGNAAILNWSNTTHGVPLELNFTAPAHGTGPTSLASRGRGLGFHAQFGGHPHCPGPYIISQLPRVLETAQKIGSGELAEIELDILDRSPGLFLPGIWSVSIGSWSGLFHFSSDKKCAWSDSKTSSKHKGTWKVVGGEVQWSYNDDPKGWQRLFHAKLPLDYVVSGETTIGGTSHGNYRMTKLESQPGL